MVPYWHCLTAATCIAEADWRPQAEHCSAPHHTYPHLYIPQVPPALATWHSCPSRPSPALLRLTR